MITDKTVFISLTGKNSHKIKIPAGQGSFSIGTRGISDGKYDVMVEPDKAIIWDSFNIYFTPLVQGTTNCTHMAIGQDFSIIPGMIQVLLSGQTNVILKIFTGFPKKMCV